MGRTGSLGFEGQTNVLDCVLCQQTISDSYLDESMFQGGTKRSEFTNRIRNAEQRRFAEDTGQYIHGEVRSYRESIAG